MSSLSIMRITVMWSAVISIIALGLALMHCSARSLTPVSIVCLISLHFIITKLIFFALIKLDKSCSGNAFKLILKVA